MALNARTIEFYKNAKIENRKKFGQFMTPVSCVEKVISGIRFNKSDKVLEPSYGSGQFMDKLIQNKSISINNIYGVELDNELFKLSQDAYKDVNLFNSNYLTQKFDTKFNVIIGNPPYFEIDDEFPSE